MFKKFKKIFGKSNKSKKVAPTTNDTATTATPTATATPTETTVVVASTITPTSPTETTTTSPINIRDNLNAIIKGIQEGRILEVFDKYYAESIEMFEGGDSTGRIGKVANRKAEEYFVANAVIQEAKVLKIIVDGNSSAYEMLMKFTFSGTPVEKTQWALQTWENGLIVKEEFNESNKTPVVAPVAPIVEEVKSVVSADIKANLNEIIKGIQEGRILEVFDKYYAETIVMSENGDSTGRVGKELNRKAEEGFVANAVIEEAKVLKIIVDGNNSAYEMFMKFTYAGHPVEKTQWALQTWENGLIVKEEFNESNKKPVAPVVAPVVVDIKANLNEIIKGIQEGRILEVFDKYYAETIIMSENGDSTGRVGKEANRKAEEGFVANAVIEEAKVLKTIVDGNNSAYEMFMKFTYAGHPVEKTQWALQTWENGLIVKEEFNESNKTPVAPAAEVSTTTPADIRSNLNEIIKGIQEGRILEVFDKYYAESIVMSENGDSTGRVGKELNRKAEEGFVTNAVIEEAKVLKIIVDGNNSAYEMYMKFTYAGHPVEKTQWALQTWENGLIVKEEFNESNKKPIVAPVVDIKANLNEIIKGIQEGRILEVFDKYYAESIEMFENGDSTGRVGKELNRKAEESFVANAVIEEAKVLKTIVDGNNSAYEMFMKFTYAGHPVEKTQWALQTWENGLIVKEEFNESNKTPVTPTVVEVAPINIRDNLNEIIKGIQEGRILEVFDKYYAESIVMSENGDSTGRVGKELNRKAEEGFVTNAVIEEAKVLKTIVDGNNSAYEMFMKFTYAGHPVEKTQWALQTWENGLIVKEEFNESNKKPVAPVAEEVKSE